MPIGEKYGGATYFMLETHYDNPSKDKDLVDTSEELFDKLFAINVKSVFLGAKAIIPIFKKVVSSVA